MRLRFASVLALAVPLVGGSCRGPRHAHPLKAENPGATFEVLLSGCSNTGVTGRRFGSDARTALLWSSERVHSAAYLPCTATIQAVRGNQRRAVYRISRAKDGAYVEQLVRP